MEIEDRALVLGLSIDKIPADDTQKEDRVTHIHDNSLPTEMISVTAQIAVPGRVPLGPGTGGSAGEGKTSPVWVVSVRGISLDDAMNNLQQQIADPRYLVHLRIIIISEEIARGSLAELNDYLRRNPEIRRRTWLLVSEGRASAFMDVNPPLQRVPTLYILSMMEKSVSSGKFPGIISAPSGQRIPGGAKALICLMWHCETRIISSLQGWLISAAAGWRAKRPRLRSAGSWRCRGWTPAAIPLCSVRRSSGLS